MAGGCLTAQPTSAFGGVGSFLPIHPPSSLHNPTQLREYDNSYLHSDCSRVSEFGTTPGVPESSRRMGDSALLTALPCPWQRCARGRTRKDGPTRLSGHTFGPIAQKERTHAQGPAFEPEQAAEAGDRRHARCTARKGHWRSPEGPIVQGACCRCGTAGAAASQTRQSRTTRRRICTHLPSAA